MIAQVPHLISGVLLARMYVRRCRPSLRPIVALDRRSVLPRRTREHPRISARSITTPAASRPAAALRAYKLRERSLPIRPLHATSRTVPHMA